MPETVGSKPLEVQSVVLRLLAEADVPAQEGGRAHQGRRARGRAVKRASCWRRSTTRWREWPSGRRKLKYDVAHEKATNDVQIRFARKAAEVAEAELQRSTESIARFAKSVSQSQLDVDRLNAEKTRLEAEQADHNQQIAVLEMKTQQNELDAAQGPARSPPNRRARSTARSCRCSSGWANGSSRARRRCGS